jgi:YggT family protein
VSSAQPPYPDEPPPPARGLTREERGRDVSEAQAKVEAETSTGKRLLKSMSPRFVLSMADGYPVVLKQFIQFCLILIYPAWLFGVLAGAAIYYSVYGVLWVVFAPMRLWMKKNRPDQYAASQSK